ncbi:MAG: glycosyltransferase [Phenylobacterium sp.]|uniref:glycosyltransferase family 4 protein n=1 Tax=Phenylobacterium sp. TaxID=1871053 RepID=UPI0025F32A3E|nr:glycosyltransferase family 4 protein [Phenylobacterium sp.]MBI1198465.1 glycosyltransferase [Phenylobacterium sp.]
MTAETKPQDGAAEAERIASELLATKPLAGRKILIIVENLPVPFDRRVWQEATTLAAAGAEVSVICPTGKGFTERRETLQGVHIYRHTLPIDAKGALGYLLEYGAALFHQTRLAWTVFLTRGIHAIHGCNPPDLIFLVALPFKLFGVRYLFDHHDINPELYEAKYEKRGFFWSLMVLFERLTFASARVVISTNNSYREIALTRGGKKPEDVFVVRSGPDLRRLKMVEPNEALKNGRKHLVGYVGVMGDQEGIDLLLEAIRHLVFDLGRDDIQFCLVGGGPSLPALQALATELGIDDYVTFTGRAPDDVLFGVLSTSAVCVNPDRVNPMNDKSTMNKIVEYMAFGKPIVQFDLTEGRVSAEEASLYAAANDPKDLAAKIVQLVDDPKDGARRGALGRERVRNHLSWNHEVPKLVSAYQRLFGKR